MQVRDLLEPLLQPWLPLLQQVLASGISLQVSNAGSPPVQVRPL